MNPAATVQPRHIAAYARDGVVLIEQAFNAEWVARLTAAIDRIIAAHRAGALASMMASNRSQNPVSTREQDGDLIVRNVMHHDPVFREWLHETAAAEIVARTIGTSHVRFWMDATFVKQGNAAATATPWHNDGCTFPFVGEHAPSFWVALTDVGLDNAPLTTLNGSHLDPWRYRSPLVSQTEPLPPGFKEWPELLAKITAPDAHVQTWLARAGDAMVIHPKIIHGSKPRTSSAPGRRIAFTTRWLGSDVRWQPNPLAVKIATLEGNPLMRVGEPPPDELFPIVWPRAAV
jgi:ectoine hydroxylase-related dioxygenase (phytanoyl-CoA dioxygenase family)